MAQSYLVAGVAAVSDGILKIYIYDNIRTSLNDYMQQQKSQNSLIKSHEIHSIWIIKRTWQPPLGDLPHQLPICGCFSKHM